MGSRRAHQYQIGPKPVSVEIIDSALAADVDAIEATLTQRRYSARGTFVGKLGQRRCLQAFGN